MAIKRPSINQLRFDLPEFDELADEDKPALAPEVARQVSEAARSLFEGREKKDSPGASGGGWTDTYLRLRELGYPWRLAVYISWAASPRNLRMPKTLQELSTQVLGLSGPRVIGIWRHKYPALDAIVAHMQAEPLWEHRRDVIEALIQSAISQDYKGFNDRKLFLELTGDYVPRSQLDLGKSAAGGIDEMSDAELRDWLSLPEDLTPQPNLTPGPFPEREGEIEEDDAD